MLSVIIVDYKTIRNTLDYINHFKKNVRCKESVHFIIVDNSEDYEGEQVFRDLQICEEGFVDNLRILIFNDIIYCSKHENLGYASGNNLGALIAKTKFNDQFFLFSNNDIFFHKTVCIDEMLSILSNKIAVVGPRVIGPDGRQQSPYKKPSFWRMMLFQYLWPLSVIISHDDRLDINSSGKVYRVMGCFMVVESNAFNLVGGFDENTFMYAEESILSERMINNGYSTYYYNDIELTHQSGGTTKKYSSFIRTAEWMFKSNYYYYQKYRRIPRFFLFLSKVQFKIYVLEKRIQFWILPYEKKPKK